MVANFVCQLYSDAVIDIGEDVENAIEDACKIEDNKLAQLNLEAILENIKLARENQVPMCQDTGLPIFFVKLGKVQVENLQKGIQKGIQKATKTIPLRPNVVNPLTRKNTNNNTGNQIPIIETELINENYIEITAFPKGFGSENNNALKMALPSDGTTGIKEFVLETVKKAGAKPCPPIVVGVGVGGASDTAMTLAKKALLEPINKPNPNPELNTLEQEILLEINKNGVGPMGMGGKTTALGVNIKTMDTHTAGLPIGVCIQCWANRHKTGRLYDK